MFDLVQRYIELDAKHKRKGYSLKRCSLGFVVEAMLEEVKELAAAPNDIDEVADALGCITHICIKNGWAPDMVYRALVHKLELRFGPCDYVGGQYLGPGAKQEASVA